MSESSLDQLYKPHLQTLMRRTEQSLAASGFDALVIHAGAPPTQFLDDQDYPFKVNPHFKAWVPIVDNPRCILVIAPGARLMAVVPLDSVWIDANFKEAQLREMRIGQPVTLTADIYGGSVTYHGRIAGLGAGSGSAFALLPPQNASGNWIKIVQRIPVRIALDPKELRDHPLRVGLSMSVKVDVADVSGPLVATQVRAVPLPKGIRLWVDLPR